MPYLPPLGGGYNRYLGNAQIEVPLIGMGLPLHLTAAFCDLLVVNVNNLDVINISIHQAQLIFPQYPQY